MPAIADVLAVATSVFAIATWVVPPVRYLLSFRKKPRDSLAVVGRVIGMFVLAALLSGVTLVLALLTLVFTDRGFWGWAGLGTIAVYWLAFATSLPISDYLSRRNKQASGQN